MGKTLRVLAEIGLAQHLPDDARRRLAEAAALHPRTGYRLGAQRVADVLHRIS